MIRAARLPHFDGRIDLDTLRAGSLRLVFQRVRQFGIGTYSSWITCPCVASISPLGDSPGQIRSQASAMAFLQRQDRCRFNLQAAVDGWRIAAGNASAKAALQRALRASPSQRDSDVRGGRRRLPSFVIVMTLQHPILQ